jgi:hypothetical protein
VGSIGGGRLKGEGNDPLHSSIADLPWRAWSGLVQEAIEPLGHEACSPFAHRLFRGAHRRRHGGIGLPVSAGEDDPGPLGQGLSGGTPAGPALQGFPLIRSQGELRNGPSDTHDEYLRRSAISAYRIRLSFTSNF